MCGSPILAMIRFFETFLIYFLELQPTDESWNFSIAELSPSASSHFVDQIDDEINTDAIKDLMPTHLMRRPSGLCRLPPVGMDFLLSQAGHIVAVPPGTICPSALFGLTHLDEGALWRHGPITKLPVSFVWKLRKGYGYILLW